MAIPLFEEWQPGTVTAELWGLRIEDAEHFRIEDPWLRLSIGPFAPTRQQKRVSEMHCRVGCSRTLKMPPRPLSCSFISWYAQMSQHDHVVKFCGCEFWCCTSRVAGFVGEVKSTYPLVSLTGESDTMSTAALTASAWTLPSAAG